MANGLFDNVYNPDVLSCLANLSNDEVFTPPEVVNQMLDMLPQELFRNSDTTFLEEKYLTGCFGEAYQAYCGQVFRCLGRKNRGDNP